MTCRKFKRIRFNFRIGMSDGYGRVYSKESVERAIKKFNEKANNTLIISESSAPMTQWAGAVKEMRINDDSVEADIITIDTPSGRALKDTLSGGAPIKFVPTFVDGAISKVNMVLAPSIDSATYETLAILHEECRLYVQYGNSIGITGFWLSYDEKTNIVSVESTDIKVNLHDPSSVDKLIHSLEELRTP